MSEISLVKGSTAQIQLKGAWIEHSRMLQAIDSSSLLEELLQVFDDISDLQRIERIATHNRRHSE
jgi:hypothetical protein